MKYPLFLSDWGRFPGAIQQSNTENHSAVRLATTLKRMNVANHSLVLMLIDPMLENVDPHSETLTISEMARVIVECKKNPWYYFREVARAPASSGADDGHFIFTRGNFAMYWLFFNHITTVNIWPRQKGKSFCSDMLAIYLLNIACKDTAMMLLTKDEKLRSDNIKRMRMMDEALPVYIQKQGRDDSRNSHEFSVNDLGNHYKGFLPSTSAKRAYMVGRGHTCPIFFVDEPVYQANVSISMPSAFTAGATVREIARAAGSPFGTILTTTAGKQDDRDGKFIYQYLNDAAIFSETFYDTIDEKKLIRVIRTNGGGKLRVNCTFNHRQLGGTDIQLQDAIDDIGVTGEDMLRDFYNVWTNGGVSSPFAMDIIDKLNSSRADPVWVQQDGDSYLTRWYVSKIEAEGLLGSNKVVIGVDTSDAMGKDDIALVAREVSTGKILAVGTYNTTSIITFARWLFDSWLLPYPKLVMIIERRSTGASIIDYLLLMLHQEGRNPFRQLFNWVTDKQLEQPMRYEEVSNYSVNKQKRLHISLKRYVGFATSGSGATSRASLYSETLTSCMETSAHHMFDAGLIEQLFGLSLKNNRIDHQAGEHDDIVVAMLMTQWFMTKAQHLRSYGLDPLGVLSNIKLVKAGDEPIEDDSAIRAEIDILLEASKGVKNPLLVSRLQRQLHVLTSKLNTHDDFYNIDKLLEEMRAIKRLGRPLQTARVSAQPKGLHHFNY